MSLELRSRHLARPSEADASVSRRGGFTVSASAPASQAAGSTRRREPAPLMSLAAAAREPEPNVSAARLLQRRPLALLSLVPTGFAMFVAGGVAGAIAKTTTAPLDRVRRGGCIAFRRPLRIAPCAAS